MATARQELSRKNKKPIGNGIMGKSKGKGALKKKTGKGVTKSK